MSVQYNETPFLFVNSTDSSIPQGRNVRTQARTQQAAQQAPVNNQEGCFALINFDLKRHCGRNESKTVRKRRKQTWETYPLNVAGSTPKLSGHTNTTLSKCIRPSGSTFQVLTPNLNPSEVLAVATFHIRRLAAMTIRSYPNRLTEILRCRQWSSVSIAVDRFGQNPCLDSALICVASKLAQMTGGKFQTFSVLANYSDALQTLQSALQDPTKHSHHDLMTSTQLLAIYEMLESIDNAAWTKHVAGAESLSLAKPASAFDAVDEDAPPFAEMAPMFTDAL